MERYRNNFKWHRIVMGKKKAVTQERIRTFACQVYKYVYRYELCVVTQYTLLVVYKRRYTFKRLIDF